MDWITALFHWNYILCVAVTGWLAAQVLKTLINAILLHEFNLERMWGSGGMPSSHSSTVCAMAVATGRLCGTDSAIFAIAFILAFIVMYDAQGVRRETGEQAKVINRMLTDWMDGNAKNAPILGDKKLKEMVGHTPFEVWAGAALGILIGFVIPIM